MFSFFESLYYNSKGADNRRKTFTLISRCLKSLGLYSTHKAPLLISVFHWVAYLLFIVGFGFGQICYIVKHYEDGLMVNLAKNYVLPESVIVIFKTLYMKRDLKGILILREKELQDAIFTPRNDKQERLTERTCNKIYNLCLLFYGSNCFAAFLLLGLPFIAYQDKSLPMPADVPFINVLKDPYYIWVYLWQFGCLYYVGFSTISYDLLAASMMMIMSNQIDLLADELDHLKVKSSEDLLEATEDQLKPVYERLYYCIEKHKAIQKIVTKFSKIYSPIVLVIFACTAVTFALTTNEISKPNQETVTYFFFIVYMLEMLIDMLLYCWTGNNIIYKSNMLTFNAYNADWYMWNKDKRRDYRMFLQFLHRPIELNVGVIYPLSLTTFTAIVKASWTYGAALRSRTQE